MILLLFAGACTADKGPPNILFIAVDDLRPELGVYGNAIIKTPNLDKLGNEGTVFLNHFVQVPTCGASRHALLTGKLPSSRVELSNRAIVENISNSADTLNPESFVQLLRDSGYYTVGIGKISHSADGYVYGYNDSVSTKLEMPDSWDERLFNSGKWETGWNAFFGYANGSNRQGMERQVPPFERGEVNDLGYPDGLSADIAVTKLRELAQRDQPFFLGVGFFKPHLPFTSPSNYWDLYDRSEIPITEFNYLPENVGRTSLHTSGEFNGYRIGERAGLDTTLSEEYSKTLVHAYYSAVSYIDHQVGKIMKALDEEGLADNTIIVVWGDHGWHLGDFRVWGKHTLFERSLKSTLMIKDPRRKTQNVESIVSTVDIYPTLIEFAGLSIDSLDGNSLVSLMDNSAVDWPNIAYGYFRNGISMRTPEYRLTKYYDRDTLMYELFDHRTNHNESKNIAHENPGEVQLLLPLLEQGNTGLYHDR